MQAGKVNSKVCVNKNHEKIFEINESSSLFKKCSDIFAVNF